VTYTFTLPAAGTYVIWGRVRAASGGDDSFWVSLDGGPFALWDIPVSSWVWDQVNNRDVADPVLFSLAAGTHTLVVKQREDGARLDRLLITSDLAFVPQGFGGDINQPPVATDDVASTASDTAVDILVLQNDSDPDQGPSALAIQGVGTPGNGTAQIVGTTSIRYTPVAGFSGTDAFSYTISDGAATATATVTVTVTGTSTELWLEAESGVLTAPMTVALDTAASGGQYVHVPNAKNIVTDPITQPGGQVTYAFTVPAGTYVIWGRVRAANGGDDSFWVSIDGGPFALWEIPVGSWVWDQVNNRNVADPVLFSLAAGTHTLVVKQREDGARLDRLLITSDLAFVP
jgi:hypothetical protein